MTSAVFPIFEAVGGKKPVAVRDRDVHLVGEELLDQLLFHISMIALTTITWKEVGRYSQETFLTFTNGFLLSPLTKLTFDAGSRKKYHIGGLHN